MKCRSRPSRRGLLALARAWLGRSSPSCSRSTRTVTFGATALLASLMGASLFGIATSHAGQSATGRAAHVVSVKDEGHLHLVGEPNGSDLVEEGPATGTIPGRVRVNFNIGPTVYASFTIYAKAGGSITGHGGGALHSTSVYSTFGGALRVVHGTGRYARAHGSGGLYGAINRKTYALTVQAIGRLYY
jgi:hypothetical protein